MVRNNPSLAILLSVSLLIAPLAACMGVGEGTQKQPTSLSSPISTPQTPASAPETLLVPTNTSLSSETHSALPPLETSPGSTPSQSNPTDPQASSTPSQIAQPSQSLEANTQYILSATLDYAAHQLVVEERIDYTNNTMANLNAIPLQVEPLRYPNAFHLSSITWPVADPPGAHLLKEDHITLLPPALLAPEESISVTLFYQLDLPATAKYTNMRPRPFGYTDSQANLGDWYPFIPPYDPAKGWLIHQPGNYGEHLVYDIADFEVSIQFSGQQKDLVVAASAPTQLDGARLRYHLPQARTFAWSASPYYQQAVESARLPNGRTTTVVSYFFPFYREAGERVAQTSARALEIYSQLFGTYTRPTLTVVQADFLDGMEYDGLFFLSKDFYNWYKGTDSELLVSIAAHETAHQWWFSRVGNDQALEPWLDEALCTYCERMFFERAHPDALDWWWTYRVDFFEPFGKIDTNIYTAGDEITSYRAYRDVVYLQGAHFFEDLRALIGDEAFFSFLRAYLEQYDNQIARKGDFFKLLGTFTSEDINPLLAKYFRSSSGR